jgi:hypothetical protein
MNNNSSHFSKSRGDLTIRNSLIDIHNEEFDSTISALHLIQNTVKVENTQIVKKSNFGDFFA